MLLYYLIFILSDFTYHFSLTAFIIYFHLAAELIPNNVCHGGDQFNPDGSKSKAAGANVNVAGTVPDSSRSVACFTSGNITS